MATATNRAVSPELKAAFDALVYDAAPPAALAVDHFITADDARLFVPTRQDMEWAAEIRAQTHCFGTSRH